MVATKLEIKRSFSGGSRLLFRLCLALYVFGSYSRFRLRRQILATGMFFFPESPRHLIATDREDEAMRILRKLHYNGQNDAWIQAEFDEIRTTIAAEKAITVPGWLVMFKVPQWRRRLMLGTAVQVFTQMTGISRFPPF
jgi:hypothetical protein